MALTGLLPPAALGFRIRRKGTLGIISPRRSCISFDATFLMGDKYNVRKIGALFIFQLKLTTKMCNKKLTSSVYDCTVEDVEYIYNKLSI